jgi:hypothetical protein
VFSAIFSALERDVAGLVQAGRKMLTNVAKCLVVRHVSDDIFFLLPVPLVSRVLRWFVS